MRLTLSKWQLSQLLFGPVPSTFTLPNGKEAILLSVERESGSGHDFNVTAYVGNNPETFYVRTSD